MPRGRARSGRPVLHHPLRLVRPRWTDPKAVLAITDPPAFTRRAAAAATDRTDVVEAGAATGAHLRSSAILKRWEAGAPACLDSWALSLQVRAFRGLDRR